MAGERALVSLYGGAKEEGLDIVQYRRLCERISKGTYHVEPRTLPPTSAAEMYHNLRASTLSYNVLERKMCQYEARIVGIGLYMLDWRCLPMSTDKGAEPAELPAIISCRTFPETVQHKETHMPTTWSVL